MVQGYIKNQFRHSSLEGGFIRLGINNRMKGVFKQAFFKIEEDIDAVIEEIQRCIKENTSCDIYIGPVTYETDRATKESVNFITALYADFDEFEGKPLKDINEEEAESCRKKMLDILLALELKPSSIVSSGNGLQVYWQLEDPLSVDGNIKLIEGALKKLAKHPEGFNGDLAAARLGHTLRLPGTKNTKDPNNIKECKTIWSDDGVKYTFDAIVDELNVVVNENNGSEPSENTMHATYMSIDPTLEEVREAAKSCEFLCHLGRHPEDQNYMLWMHLAINLAIFGENGRVLFHRISEKYPGYNKNQSERIFSDALKRIKTGEYSPSRCTTICEAGFECPKTCKQTTPAGMILSKLMQGRRKKPQSEEVNLDVEVENLVSKVDLLENIRLLETFIKEKINPSNNSLILKEAYLKKAMEVLEIPVRGYFSSFKKQIKEKVSSEDSDNIFVEIGDEILKELDLASIGEQLYHFDNGVWNKYTENLNRMIIEKLGDEYTKKNVDNVLFYVESKSYVATDKINNYKKENLICLSNGMLKISKNGKPKLLPHDKKYYALNQLNLSYNRAAKCPKWEKFLDDSFRLLPESDKVKTIEAIQEWFGYSLIAGNELQRMLFIIGRSRTGKGVVLDCYSALLGLENLASIPIGTIDKEFNSINLMDKLANVGPEIGQNEKFNVSFVKSAVGEDLISGRYLHKNLVSFKNDAKLVFASNHMPQILDTSDAMYERALCIEMNNVVPKEKRNPYLKAELKEELPGILNWAIEGRIRLYNRGRFLESPSMMTLKNSVKEMNNSTLHWFNSEKDSFDKEDKYILFKKCFDSYRDFCMEEGYKPLTRSEFKKTLNDIDGISVTKPSKPNQDCVFIDWKVIGEEEVGEMEKVSDSPTKQKSYSNADIEEMIRETIEKQNKDWAAFA